MNINTPACFPTQPFPASKGEDDRQLDLDLDGPAAMLRDERRFRDWCARRRSTNTTARQAPASGIDVGPEEAEGNRRLPGGRSRFSENLRPTRAIEPAWE